MHPLFCDYLHLKEPYPPIFPKNRQTSAPAAMRGQGRPISGIQRAQYPTVTRDDKSGLVVSSSRMVSVGMLVCFLVCCLVQLRQQMTLWFYIEPIVIASRAMVCSAHGLPSSSSFVAFSRHLSKRSIVQLTMVSTQIKMKLIYHEPCIHGSFVCVCTRCVTPLSSQNSMFCKCTCE